MARTVAIKDGDGELPEADRLEGFPHPRHTARLFGHEAAEAELAHAFASGRMHHGWLIAGREGIGKASLAYRFARHALAEAEARRPGEGALVVAEESPAASQVRALSHPGLLVIRREFDLKTKRFPTVITVDDVRRIKAFLARTADQAAWRVVIVDRADELNLNAANALLKSLEEPPPRTTFLLLSSAVGRLLPTIRSRCRVLKLDPLASEPLRRAVIQAVAATGEGVTASTPGPSDWPRLEALSGGSARRALALHAGGGLKLYDRLAGLLRALPKVDWGAVHGLGDELGGAAADPQFQLFHELLLAALADGVRTQAHGGGDDVLGAAVRAGALSQWADLWERLAADKAEAQLLNLDRRALILDAFAQLEGAARGQFRD